MRQQNHMRTLITGGSGLLAMNWAFKFQMKHEICLITHSRIVQMPGVKSIQLNSCSNDQFKNLCTTFSPELIVHTAGYTSVDGCEREPEKAIEANTVLASNVAQTAHAIGAKLIHISTDHLFNGEKSNVDENEAASPINVYGETKLNAEKYVLEHCPDALVIRTNFFGLGHRKRHSITDWIINSIESGQPIKAFGDVFFTPIFVDDLVDSIYQLIDKRASGIINVVSDERISKYDFALLVAEIFELDKKLIVKSRLSDIELFAKRPRDMSLSNAKAANLLGRGLGSVSEGLSRLRSVSDRSLELNRALLD